MAVEFDLMLERAVLDKEMMLDELESYGAVDKALCLNKKQSFTCASYYESHGFMLYLLNKDKPASSIWDTQFPPKEFVYSQVLTFRFNHEFDSQFVYEHAIRIILSLMDKVDSRALLDMCMLIELAFFDNDKSVIINTKSAIWSYSAIRKELSGWDVKEVELVQ